MIYDSFFGFTEEPFGVTPNPRFLFLSKVHEDALAHIKFGISENKGFVMLTGEIGSGKTTIMKYFIESLDEKTHTAVIFTPKVQPLELLKLIIRDFAIQCIGKTYDDLITCLNDFLIECYSKGERVLIFIDEAQNLGVECLEFVRMLSNLETATRKLLQVVLIGQPELRDIVRHKKLRQLDQRIAVRYHIGALKRDEIEKYIYHRLKKAGSIILFPQKSFSRIYRYSRGLPRLINIACDRVLLAAYSNGQIKINNKIIKEAMKEIGVKKKSILIYVFASLLVSIGIIWFFNEQIKVNIVNILNHFKSINTEEKTEKKARFSMDADGMVMVTDPGDAKDACFLSLMMHWNEVNLPLTQESETLARERGYSVYSFGSDWDRLARLNMPSIILSKENNRTRWGVLLWIINEDAVIFDPLEGKMIIPLRYLKNSVLQFVMLWKNNYNTPDRIKKFQRILRMQGYLNRPETGFFGKITKEALKRFQRERGIPESGEFDIETMIILSKDEMTPEIFPHEITKREG